MADRCRLCTANDHEALIEQVAEQLWESRRRGSLDNFPWADAGPYWKDMMRDLAATSISALR